MGFIKHAIIGIALYEAVKYVFKRAGADITSGEHSQVASATHQRLRHEDIDVIAGARQTDQLERMKENAAPRHDSVKEQDDPWANSLANDELRAPDS